MSYQVGCKQILLIQVSVNFSISPLLKKNFISYYWSERNKTRSNAINKRQTSIKRVTKAPTISRHACVVFYVVLCSKILYPGASRFKTLSPWGRNCVQLGDWMQTDCYRWQNWTQFLWWGKFSKSFTQPCPLENSIFLLVINLNIPASTAAYNMNKFFWKKVSPWFQWTGK